MDHAARAVHFVLGNLRTHWRDIEALCEGDIDVAPRRFVAGRNSWIAQGYVRLAQGLRDAGWRVTAGDRFEPDAICLVHRDDANDFSSGASAGLLVVVRADRAPVAACDIAIVQNGIAMREGEHHIALWPQPGLIARDPARGTNIFRIAYHGRTGKAPRWFTDLAFHRELARRGMKFVAEAERWEDYRRVDIAVAAREESPSVLATKPATKVYNAWIAGVPLLAMGEPAYLEVKRTGLDFIEIASAEDVIRAIDVLRKSPALYEAMVANGRERGRDYGVAAIRARWIRFLEEEAAPMFASRRARGARAFWHMRSMAAQKMMSRSHRLRVAGERLLLAWPPPPWRPAALSVQRARDDLADVSG